MHFMPITSRFPDHFSALFFQHTRPDIHDQQFSWIMNPNRNRMFSCPSAYQHMLTVSVEISAAECRKRLELRRKQAFMSAKSHDPAVIMTTQSKIRSPVKIGIAVFRTVCKQDIQSVFRRLPDQFSDFFGMKLWRKRLLIIDQGILFFPTSNSQNSLCRIWIPSAFSPLSYS